MKPARTSIVLPPLQDEQLATIERTIGELTQYRDRKRNKALKASYQAAIDRLGALTYRLREAAPVQAALAASPPEAPAPPAPADAPMTAKRARASAIVIARKPRGRR